MKGVRKLGVRLGNWLTAEQGETLWQTPDREHLKGKRDRAPLAVLLACGLRRHEAVDLNLSHLQRREDHWAIVDLMAEAGHTRAVPMPEWVKQVVDDWLHASEITSGRLFRRVNRAGRVWSEAMTEKVVWHVVREFATKAGIDKPGVCRREKSSHVESTTYKPLGGAKCLYVIDSTLVDIFIPTDS